MKKIRDKVLDCRRQILQLLILAIVFFIPKLIDISGKINRIFNGSNPDFENVRYYYLMKIGNWGAGLVFLIITLYYIYKNNKDIMINTGNFYHNHSYIWYWFCSKILGYKKCRLVLVPVYMQFKLVIRDTFQEYDCGADDEYKQIEHENILIREPVIEKSTNTVNLVLSDTYPIDKALMPESTRNIPIIFIQRESNKTSAVRSYSEDFIEAVLDTVRKLPQNIYKINLYPVTNAKHTSNLARRVFKMADRSNINEFVVYPQERKNGKWDFAEKGIKIY